MTMGVLIASCASPCGSVSDPCDVRAYPCSSEAWRIYPGQERGIGMLKIVEAACRSWRGKLLFMWIGLDALLYLGAVMTLALALSDRDFRPYTYGFTIALVTSWALRMAYGISIEVRRVRIAEQEKARRLNEILKKHGITGDQSESVAREIRDTLGTT